MHSGYWLIASIGLPLIAAAVLLFVPDERHDIVRWLSAGVGAALFAISVFVFFAYELDRGGGFQFFIRWDWLQNTAFLRAHGISLAFGVDGIAAPMVLLTGIVCFGGALISWKIEHHNKDFFILFWVLVAGVYGTFESLDLFFFFFFYEVAVLPMYLLIAVWGSSSTFPTFTRTKEYSAMKLTIMLVSASILIFLGIFAVFQKAGAGTFDLQTLYAVQFDENFQKAVFPLFVIGCGVLAGLWPFHTWSPDGHVSAPTAVSMLHAGVLMKLGAFGIIRLGIQLLPAGATFWMPGLMVLATVNVVYGAFAATAQRDFKYMIGYSSVSHMGLVLMGLATMNTIGIDGAVLQMFSHGVMTATFFAMVGSVYDQAHTRDMTLFGGLVQKMPFFVFFFGIAGLASLGLPGLSGFVAEFNVFVGTFQTYPWAAALGIFAAAITAVYILRMMSMALFGPFNERWASLKEMTYLERGTASLLLGFILFMGLWPAPFVDRISETVRLLPGVS
ncbi:MAG: NADH-quinone oxidoreductase subunit M [Dehalococcoidia bacterium]|nr:NADH-quinone oxidoreductase subunit M [Dehalococcoidia bacterium]